MWSISFSLGQSRSPSQVFGSHPCCESIFGCPHCMSSLREQDDCNVTIATLFSGKTRVTSVARPGPSTMHKATYMPPRSPSACCQGRPPAAATEALLQFEPTAQSQCRTTRRKATQPTCQVSAKNVNCFGGGSGGESLVSFSFCSAACQSGSSTHIFKERETTSFSGSNSLQPGHGGCGLTASSCSDTTHTKPCKGRCGAFRGRTASLSVKGRFQLGPTDQGKCSSTSTGSWLLDSNASLSHCRYLKNYCSSSAACP